MKATRELAVPSESEITAILEVAMGKDATTWAAILLMVRLGLRVGALPGMSITGDRYTTTSKGKELCGQFGAEIRLAIARTGLAIARTGLPLRSPFGRLSAPAIAEWVREITERMHAEGRLKAAYSAHDLRHAFAVRLYQETHDVYKVRVALGHANVSVIEKYSRSLGLAE